MNTIEPNLINVAECLNITDVNVLIEQTNVRRNLIKTMVGNLYPNLVADEIATINNHIAKLRENEPKQVIVMRKDLNMRKGKMIAQGAHASMAVLLDMMVRTNITHLGDTTPSTHYAFVADSYVREWLEGRFTKVCVSVNSEQELLGVYNKAMGQCLPAALITDSGLTEFNLVPTHTCCAIGPWRRKDIDAITGHLSLL